MRLLSCTGHSYLMAHTVMGWSQPPGSVGQIGATLHCVDVERERIELPGSLDFHERLRMPFEIRQKMCVACVDECIVRI